MRKLIAFLAVGLSLISPAQSIVTERGSNCYTANLSHDGKMDQGEDKTLLKIAIDSVKGINLHDALVTASKEFTHLIFSAALGFGAAMFIQVNPFILVGVFYALSFIPIGGPDNVLCDGIRREAFVREIKENLFDDNPYVNMGINHSAFANDLAINVPQAGANPNVEIDRAVLPAVINQRTDTNLQYFMNEFSSDPFLIPAKDMAELNYNKRQSIMRQHIDTINDDIADRAAFNYATNTTARQVITTGNASGDALAPGATGTRLGLTKEDIRKIAAQMDSDRVPKSGRKGVIDSDMYYQLFDDATMINRDTINKAVLPDGVVNRLWGIDLMVRSKVVVYDVGGSKKLISAATATDDNLGGIFFHVNSISWAQTTIEVLIREKKNNPEWYGTILSAIVRYGSAIIRSDEKGIVSLIQGT